MDKEMKEKETKKAPRPLRTGHIKQLGPNRWQVKICTGRDAEGKPRYSKKNIRGRKKDADDYLAEKLREVSTGTFIDPSKLTLGHYLDRWLAAIRSSLSERTAADYSEYLARYIKEPSPPPPVNDEDGEQKSRAPRGVKPDHYLSSRKLASITPIDIQTLYSDLQQKGLGSRPIRMLHVILKDAFSQAVKWRMLKLNPADGVELPKKTRRKMQALDAEQARGFLDAAKEDQHGIVFAFALATGMRPEEYLALRWSDIDFARGTAIVTRVLCWRRQKGGGYYYAPPKTDQSRRTVPLPEFLLQQLFEHKQRQVQEEQAGNVGELVLVDASTTESEDQDLVFRSTTGGPLHSDNLGARNFKSILKRAGLPKIRLYDLRHTHATLLLLAGEHPKVVSERLGHASVTITMDTYSHVMPTMQRAAAEKIEKLLAGSQAGLLTKG
jgi:integrase